MLASKPRPPFSFWCNIPQTNCQFVMHLGPGDLFLLACGVLFFIFTSKETAQGWMRMNN
jgi:hypothetical protein